MALGVRRAVGRRLRSDRDDRLLGQYAIRDAALLRLV
jgi:hypothetical protein